MSHTYVTPLKLEIKPSLFFLQIHALIYLLAAISILMLPWLFMVQCGCLVVLIYVGQKSYRKHNQSRLLIWKQANDWLISASGIMQPMQLQASSFISLWLAILNFKSENRTGVSLILFSDAVDKQQFRQLRVRLKVEGYQSVSHDKMQT